MVRRPTSTAFLASFSHLLVAFLVITGLAVWAQAPADPTDWVVDNWQTEAGLPMNVVTCVRQTKDGYLWIGTANGLARFDGVQFTVFRVADGLGLTSNRILCLFEDANGVLWVGTEDGGLASLQKGRFAALTAKNGLSSDHVLCLGEDLAGALWAGTDSGLNRLSAGRFATFFKTDGLPDDRVNAVCRRGNTLIFATGNGVCEFRGDLLLPARTTLPPGTRTNLGCLLTDRFGSLWLGGDNGLVRTEVRDTGARAFSLATTSTVTALIQSRDGPLWLGSTSGEIGRVLVSESGVELEAVWHTPRGVTSLWEDQEANLWVGTSGTGLYRIKRRQLRIYPASAFQGSDWASSLFRAADGDLHLVGRDNGVYHQERGGWVIVERLPLPEGVAAHTACQAATGELWIGTLRDGLFHCGKDGCRQFSERDGLSDSAIEALCADAGGLWIGTRNGGLNYFNGRSFSRYNTPWGFGGAFACALQLDASGGLWIGTTGDGLFEFRNGRFRAYTTAAGLPSGQVHALEADSDGSLWAGTARGLCRVKDGRITGFQGGGLTPEPVYQLQSDATGGLWMGNASRVLRVDKKELEARVADPKKFFSVVPYGREDGAAGVQCLARVQSSGGTNRDEGIWFATATGLLVIDQAGHSRNELPPRVVIEDIFVDNQPQEFEGRLVVPPGKESLRFDFTALSLTAPDKVSFRYQLEGFDRELSEPVATRSARYPKVPPGNYRFRVLACNNDGVWNETGAAVEVACQPFWWATNWFRGAVVAAVTATGAGFFRLRQARRREIERLRVRIAGDLHDDLGSSLWSITLLSRMLAKHGNVGDAERQDISEINRIAVQSANAIRDIIWLINPTFDSLQDLVLRTKDFAGTALRGVDYRMTCEIPDLSRKLPFELRHNLFLFFKEALTNVARHARATAVEVRLEEREHQWKFTITDNGAGFDPSAQTAGNGLKNLRLRAERMGARLDIRSRPGAGSAVALTISRP